VNHATARYLFLLILMTILFGLTFVASKVALQGIGIFQLVFLRHFFALVLLSAILWRNRYKFYIAKRDRKQFLLLTLIEPIGYFIFETIGINFTTPSNVSLIIATIPIFSLMFALWILGEKVNRYVLLGIFFSLLGVYLIVSLQKKSVLAPKPLLGNIFALGAAVSAGIYNSLCRRLTQTYSPWTITYSQAVVATFVFLPLAVNEIIFIREPFLDLKIFFSVLYLAIGGSVIAYLILNYTLGKLPTYKVAIFANFIPVVTIFASWLIYGDMMTSVQFIGAGFVVFGIYLTYVRYRN
jgi:drug/metabolite transporter (DMT)-like permease